MASQIGSANGRQCPHCGSNDVIKVNAVHQQGTSSFGGRQWQMGASLSGTGDGISPSVAIGGFDGTNQTSVARRFAPPAVPVETNESLLGLYIGGVLVMVSLIIMGCVQTISSVLLWVICAVGFTMIWYAIKNKSREKADNALIRLAHANAMQRYLSMWYCKSCGGTFIHEPRKHDV